MNKDKRKQKEKNKETFIVSEEMEALFLGVFFLSVFLAAVGFYTAFDVIISNRSLDELIGGFSTGVVFTFVARKLKKRLD